MLRRLSVENYALIDKLELELDAHLNIITGETGAGKSILLGALGLLLGNKNDGSAIKDTSRNCIVEGLFSLAGHDMRSFFDDNDIDYSDETSVRRMITPAGKSRAFINDIPVQLSQLKDFGAQLIDIHSQHQNLILSSEEFRTDAVDTIADAAALRSEYAAAYARLSELRRQLTALRDAAALAQKDEEWIRFQVEELTAAALRQGEQAELEQEQAVLANADQIGEVLIGMRNAMDDDEVGIMAQLKVIETNLAHIRDNYPAAADFYERLHSIVVELKDINATVAIDSERIESDPTRLKSVDDRLNTIYSLCQKHHVATLDELISVRENYTAKLNAITNGDEQIIALEAALTEQKGIAEALAERLHKARAKAAPTFEKAIVATLSKLGMPETTFRVELADRGSLTQTGRDEISFLFTANKSVSPQPVERIASGGEMSRVMLALKALLAERMQLPTIIFDEIDTGVSGRIADAMGEIICSLGDKMQVVDITHLPQVASKGRSHFVVYKADGQTNIARLSDNERVTEIAKMMSGSEITAAALEQAKILLGKAL